MHAARVPLAARAGPTSPPRCLARRPPPGRELGPHALLAPSERLRAVRRECAALDQELRVIENSGHARIGVFARPLATQMKVGDERGLERVTPDAEGDCRDPFLLQFFDDEGRSLFEQLLRARMRAVALAKLAFGARSIAFARAKVELAEAYARMNLWKQGHPHAVTARNVIQAWETGEITRSHEEASGRASSKRANLLESSALRSILAQALVYFYELQRDEGAQGQVELAALAGYVQIWEEVLGKQGGDGIEHETTDADRPETGLFAHSSLVEAFDSSPSIHWQQLLVRMEQCSAPFQGYVDYIEQQVSPEAISILRDVFHGLDVARRGCVSVGDFIAVTRQRQHELQLLHIQCQREDDISTGSVAIACLTALLGALKRERRCINWPKITWCEVMEIGRTQPRFVNLTTTENDDGLNDADDADAECDDDEDDSHTIRSLNARIDLFLSRTLLKSGQLENAVRSIHLAIATQERLCEDHFAPGDSLVPFYFAAVEILAVRSKQLRVRCYQASIDLVERWLQSVEGIRSVRARALVLIDEHHQETNGVMLSKRDAEAQAAVFLRQERIAATTNVSKAGSETDRAMPVNALALLDEAVELCNKAWSLLEQYLGREHISTAAVHVALAQLYFTKGDTAECVKCYARAVAIYEGACNGPVPASALVQLEIARANHHQAIELSQSTSSNACSSAAAAKQAYLEVADFFQSFALEFPDLSSTRRECCVLALDAFRQWLTLARTLDTPANNNSSREVIEPCWPRATLEEQREVLERLYKTTIDGYGEFSIEASDAAKELSLTLRHIGGEANMLESVYLLRITLIVYESHYGAGDRRSRQVRKELVDARRSLSSRSGDEEIDGGDWLTI